MGEKGMNGGKENEMEMGMWESRGSRAQEGREEGRSDGREV